MQIIQDRQALHRIPELDHDLPKTLAYLKNTLSGLGCRVFSPTPSALCAYFDFGKAETIAFRSDMDALPIAEKTGLPFASCHEGRMHACGHDGHMAMLLELARRLNEEKELPYNVLLVFQPAEETTGGAREICDSGVFGRYRVRAIYGMHLWPGFDEGQILSRRCEMMSRSCEVHVEVFGHSAHVAKASEGLDATAAAVEFFARATAMEKTLPEHIFRLLKFGKFHSGTVGNALSGYARIDGTLRAFQDEVFFSLQQQLRQIAEDIEGETGCTIRLELGTGYPAVINPDGLYDAVRASLPFAEMAEPSMITEDFSWYQKTVPGLFFFLGTGDTPALHADNFNFNETILMKGADFMEKLARIQL